MECNPPVFAANRDREMDMTHMTYICIIHSFGRICLISIEMIIRWIGCRAICEFDSIAKECTKQNERENFNWEKHRMLQDERSLFVQSWQVALYLFCFGKWFVLQHHSFATDGRCATKQFEPPLRGVPWKLAEFQPCDDVSPNPRNESFFFFFVVSTLQEAIPKSVGSVEPSPRMPMLLWCVMSTTSWAQLQSS